MSKRPRPKRFSGVHFPILVSFQIILQGLSFTEVETIKIPEFNLIIKFYLPIWISRLVESAETSSEKVLINIHRAWFVCEWIITKWITEWITERTTMTCSTKWASTGFIEKLIEKCLGMILTSKRIST